MMRGRASAGQDRRERRTLGRYNKLRKKVKTKYREVKLKMNAGSGRLNAYQTHGDLQCRRVWLRNLICQICFSRQIVFCCFFLLLAMKHYAQQTNPEPTFHRGFVSGPEDVRTVAQSSPSRTNESLAIQEGDKDSNQPEIAEANPESEYAKRTKRPGKEDYN